jgi:hypothetical protein
MVDLRSAIVRPGNVVSRLSHPEAINRRRVLQQMRLRSSRDAGAVSGMWVGGEFAQAAPMIDFNCL